MGSDEGQLLLRRGPEVHEAVPPHERLQAVVHLLPRLFQRRAPPLFYLEQASQVPVGGLKLDEARPDLPHTGFACFVCIRSFEKKELHSQNACARNIRQMHLAQLEDQVVPRATPKGRSAFISLGGRGQASFGWVDLKHHKKLLTLDADSGGRTLSALSNNTRTFVSSFWCCKKSIYLQRGSRGQTLNSKTRKRRRVRVGRIESQQVPMKQ